jgi:hypothetical protein
MAKPPPLARNIGDSSLFSTFHRFGAPPPAAHATSAATADPSCAACALPYALNDANGGKRQLHTLGE